MKRAGALIFVLLSSEYVYMQTAADIQAKYGKPVAAYSVSEHIWMTPNTLRTAKSVVCGSILNVSVLTQTTVGTISRLPNCAMC